MDNILYLKIELLFLLIWIMGKCLSFNNIKDNNYKYIII
jgi:hypothetical protein